MWLRRTAWPIGGHARQRVRFPPAHSPLSSNCNRTVISRRSRKAALILMIRTKGLDRSQCGFALPAPHAIIAAMTYDARLTEAFARLPDYLGSHVLVSITALALGL